jgi:hypothetical protein
MEPYKSSNSQNNLKTLGSKTVRSTALHIILIDKLDKILKLKSKKENSKQSKLMGRVEDLLDR